MDDTPLGAQLRESLVRWTEARWQTEAVMISAADDVLQLWAEFWGLGAADAGDVP